MFFIGTDTTGKDGRVPDDDLGGCMTAAATSSWWMTSSESLDSGNCG